MENIVFIQAYTPVTDYKNSNVVQVPLESFITYFIYKYCLPTEVSLNIVTCSEEHETSIDLHVDGLQYIDQDYVPWQVASCVYPVVMCNDTIITGLCAVARHICKYKSMLRNTQEHEEGLLGFRKSCLQAPNEVSIWTKFCEVDIIKTVMKVLNADQIDEIPKNLVRFENHLKKPVRVHNVYKLARELKKENLKVNRAKAKPGNKENSIKENVHIEHSVKKSKDVQEQVSNTTTDSFIESEKVRPKAKNRKWNSNVKKELVADCSVKIEDLQISHQFAEGPFLTLADLILLPTYHIIVQSIGHSFKSLLPCTYRWYTCVAEIPEVQKLTQLIKLDSKLILDNIIVPATEDVSLYKCDPKRHNPKKRLFTKEDDIENALSCLKDGMELEISGNELESTINWNEIPDGANPNAGHLPDERVIRKSQQLENLTLAVLSIAKEGDLIVDFCCGSGHLGIVIAHLLPKCTIILLENKEQSLLRARERVHEMGLNNVIFFQCNLDFFNGKFDIGIGLHACGIASDLLLDKCLKVNAKFVLCPCCYGSLHATDRLVYPRSSTFSSVSIDKYLCIGHAADQTHEEHPLTVRGSRCMAAIDSDRARLAQEFGYKVTLSKLKPLTCTPKNNLLIGVPS